MDSAKGIWAKYMPTRRRLIQVYAALLYNANIKGFINGDIYTGALKNVCVPGLNCYSCPGAIGACPLGALQNALASTGSRAPYYILGILLLFGLTLGRMICGFLCPFGLIQEWLHKIPTPKLKKSRVTRALSWLKYVILIVFVIALPLYFAMRQFPLPAFCKFICPAGTFEGAVGLLANPINAELFTMLGIVFTRKFVILIVIVAACVFIYRAFCRFLCPLGAIYGLFSNISLLGVKVDPVKCTNCGNCVRHCKLDIKRVSDHECVQCGECVGVCPTKAISWKLVKPGKRKKARVIIAWALAIMLLAGVIWYVNRPTAESAPVEQVVDDGTPVGYEVGMRAPDFTVPLYAGGEFTLNDMRGKVVIVNFWATWCGPCVHELPYFEKAYEAWKDDIALVAVHSHLVTDDVQAYIDKQGFTLPFALDADGSVIKSLGGELMLPMTVVIDREGKIVYNKIASVTYEILESLVTPLLQA